MSTELKPPELFDLAVVIPYDGEALVGLPIFVDVGPLDRAEHLRSLDEALFQPPAITFVQAQGDRPPVVHRARQKTNLPPQCAPRAPGVYGDGSSEHQLGDPNGLVNGRRYADRHSALARTAPSSRVTCFGRIRSRGLFSKCSSRSSRKQMTKAPRRESTTKSGHFVREPLDTEARRSQSMKQLSWKESVR